MASLFLKGVEVASFINDVCNLPLKAYNFYLYNYFDAQAFQTIYALVHSQQPDFMSRVNKKKNIIYLLIKHNQRISLKQRILFFIKH